MALKYIPLNVAADELGVSVRHVYNLVCAGHLKAMDISASGKSGKLSLRISRESIDIFIRGRAVKPSDLTKEAPPE